MPDLLSTPPACAAGLLVLPGIAKVTPQGLHPSGAARLMEGWELAAMLLPAVLVTLLLPPLWSLQRRRSTGRSRGASASSQATCCSWSASSSMPACALRVAHPPSLPACDGALRMPTSVLLAALVAAADWLAGGQARGVMPDSRAAARASLALQPAEGDGGP